MLLIMAKPQKTLDAFFKRKDSSESPTSLTPCQINVEHSTLAQEQRPPKSPRIESRKDDNLNSLQRDPGLRQQIWNYLVNERDEIRRAYIKAGPYHVVLSKYPASGPEDHPRRFQSSCKGANQIGTLWKTGDTHWGSHFHSVYSLIKMFKATCEVLQSIVKRGSNYSQPVSTATTEISFLAMKIIKTSLRNKMGDGFLANYLVVHIEKEIAEIFSTEYIVFDFCSMKERKAQV
ncbi:uncharacterized protein LOC127901453 isoform X7 [Citrus sinensis]|uniref:uncharacterized protein LOC127901453 isoform X7 n=1 Tax=Citrus sinensis TaxID=2711 RepID=UPI0022799967|nr:uncharacterized protein LOC127901453 isoform X7 [Citrus sinensis]